MKSNGTTTSLLPFNLGEATKNPERLVTEFGYPATILDPNFNGNLLGYYHNEEGTKFLFVWKPDGTALNGDRFGLQLLPVDHDTLIVWVNVFRRYGNHYYMSKYSYNSEQEALDDSAFYSLGEYVGAHQLTIKMKKP